MCLDPMSLFVEQHRKNTVINEPFSATGITFGSNNGVAIVSDVILDTDTIALL